MSFIHHTLAAVVLKPSGGDPWQPELLSHVPGPSSQGFQFILHNPPDALCEWDSRCPGWNNLGLQSKRLEEDSV